MNYQAPGTKQLYRADPNMVHQLTSLRNHLQNICRQHINQKVRVQTIDGHVYEGTIVNCEGGILYLRVEDSDRVYGPDPLILTLVLYELLIITLLILY
ncbi:hypothetical protein SAMN05192534_11613 [Alteribacillus persepolensis]|uniref:Uncharacterized protein n=1 Tax=Alteribacillus persepolensis TaxID=568899 RepID=A0A1G8GJM3_9BACI|nr:hypothetical protein [Alteribacillus persepolensis]SDH94598.1 hypothetical protein SAMN05192534_11613 [Alteribacillus persepolensis]